MLDLRCCTLNQSFFIGVIRVVVYQRWRLFGENFNVIGTWIAFLRFLAGDQSICAFIPIDRLHLVRPFFTALRSNTPNKTKGSGGFVYRV